MANPDAPSDTPDDLKKRARRRLVGAIALALLAVIVLPTVMDHEPKPVSQDIQIKIPSQESDDLIPRALPAQSSVVPPAATEVLPKTDISTVSSDKLQEDSKAEPKQPDPVVVKHQQDAAKSDTDVAPAAKPNEKTVPEKTIPARSPEEAHAVAAINGADEQWLIRLGAYQNVANVKQLLAKVKEAGIAAYAEKFDSSKGPRTRVLAGPFNSRDAAEKAQAKIKKLGVDGAVATK